MNIFIEFSIYLIVISKLLARVKKFYVLNEWLWYLNTDALSSSFLFSHIFVEAQLMLPLNIRMLSKYGITFQFIIENSPWYLYQYIILCVIIYLHSLLFCVVLCQYACAVKFIFIFVYPVVSKTFCSTWRALIKYCMYECVVQCHFFCLYIMKDYLLLFGLGNKALLYLRQVLHGSAGGVVGPLQQVQGRNHQLPPTQVSLLFGHPIAFILLLFWLNMWNTGYQNWDECCIDSESLRFWWLINWNARSWPYAGHTSVFCFVLFFICNFKVNPIIDMLSLLQFIMHIKNYFCCSKFTNMFFLASSSFLFYCQVFFWYSQTVLFIFSCFGLNFIKEATPIFVVLLGVL